jgi:hypothetical protein
MPGVTIGDDGPKAGLLGVDNGRLSFDHVRVPRDMLLDRYGQVAEDGTYTSSIENETPPLLHHAGHPGARPGQRRWLRVRGDQARPGHRRRYGETRRQFSAPGADREVLLNDYLVHQRKLLPALATTYAYHFAQEELVGTMHDVQGAEDLDEDAQRELESRAAGLKAAQTWHATRTIQMAREACGGAGYLQENRLPHLKADTDVFTTFEGDNTVLLQLVAKGLLTGYRDAFGSLDGWGKVGFVADMVRETGARADGGPRPDRPPRRRRPRPGRRGAAARPRLAAEDARGPREARARGGDPAAAPQARIPPGSGPSTSSTTSRTTCCGPRRCTSTASCWRPSSPASSGRPTWAPGRCSSGSATCTRCRPSRPTGAGSSSTGG